MLEIRDLHVKFHTRQREAVAGVSLTIHDGEILGLVGESGSGKSVTAMSVAGLLPRKQCDFSGEILLDGAELLHADRTLLRQVQGREIGVVFQEPQSCMDPLMRIGPQVEEVLRIHTDLSRERSVWIRSTSSTWGPIRIRGSMQLCGSWNTTPISLPWTCRSSVRSAWSSSAPSSRISPEKSHCFRGSSPATLMAVTDLPEPDSPTSPRISPSWMVRDTPATASRCRVWNFTCRSRISSIRTPPRSGAAGPRR